MLHSTPPGSDLRERLVRGLSALPDAITAAGFLLLWCFPLALGANAVRNGILLALVEFVTIHASVMLGHFAFSAELARTRKAASLAIFGGFYTLFVGGFVPALIFGVAVGNVLQGVPFRLTEDLRTIYENYCILRRRTTATPETERSLRRLPALRKPHRIVLPGGRRPFCRLNVRQKIILSLK